MVDFKRLSSEFHLTIKIGCTPDVLMNQVGLVDDSNQYITGIFHSIVGCRVDHISALWSWFDQNKWPMFMLFSVVGIIMCFLGNRFLQPILFITGVAEASFLLMLICYTTFARDHTEVWIGWVILVVSLGIGLGIGYLFIKYQRLGAFALAAWGGFSIGLLVYNAVLYKADS